MSVLQRRLKLITFTLNAVSFECQVNSWTLDPGIQDGDRQYTFCPDGQFTEETDPDPTLALKFFSDWRANGISDFLWAQNGNVVPYVLDHHPDIAAEHVRFSGTARIKAGPVGGDARTTEITETTLQLQEMPVYLHL